VKKFDTDSERIANIHFEYKGKKYPRKQNYQNFEKKTSKAVADRNK